MLLRTEKIVVLVLYFLLNLLSPTANSTIETLILKSFIKHCNMECAKHINIHEHYTDIRIKHDFNHLQLRFIELLEHNFSVTITSNKLADLPEPKTCNLVMLDTFNALRLLIPRKNVLHDGVNDDYLIVWHEFATKSKNESITQALQPLINYLWDIDLTRIIIFVIAENNEHLVYGYNVFSERYCRKPTLVPLPLSHWLTTQNFFLNSLTNWHRCPLRVVTWNIPPYVILRPKKLPIGMEFWIVQDIAKHLNATLMVKEVPNDDSNVFLINGSSSEGTQLLKHGKVDMCIGSMARNIQRNMEFRASIFYMQTSLYAYAMPLWDNVTAYKLLIEPLQETVWLLLFLCIFISRRLLAQLPIKIFMQRVLLICIGHPTNFTRAWRMRYIFLLLSLITLVLRAGHVGIMYRGFSIKHKLPLNNMEDLRKYRYIALATKNTINGLRDGDVYKDEIPVIYTNATTAEHLHILESNPNQRYITFSSYVIATYYYTRLKRPPKVLNLPPVLRSHQNAIYFRKHSFIRRVIDNQIALLRDMGIIQIYRRQFLNNDFGPGRIRHGVVYQKAEPIQLIQLAGIFQGLLVFWYLSVLVFAVEVIRYRYH